MIRYETRPAPKPVTCHHKIRNAMAETMREMGFGGENVTPETLQQRGFTAAAIERFGAEAVAIARRRSVRHVETL